MDEYWITIYGPFGTQMKVEDYCAEGIPILEMDYLEGGTIHSKIKHFISDLKGKSSLMIFQKWGNMKFAYWNREFWCKGYYVDIVGKNTAAIKEYIANQLKHDKESDQLSVFDPNDPFKGSK